MPTLVLRAAWAVVVVVVVVVAVPLTNTSPGRPELPAGRVEAGRVAEMELVAALALPVEMGAQPVPAHQPKQTVALVAQADSVQAAVAVAQVGTAAMVLAGPVEPAGMEPLPGQALAGPAAPSGSHPQAPPLQELRLELPVAQVAQQVGRTQFVAPIKAEGLAATQAATRTVGLAGSATPTDGYEDVMPTDFAPTGIEMSASGISDIHIHTVSNGASVVADVAGSLVYPGPRSATEQQAPLIQALCEKCLAVGRSDFMIEEGGHFYRGRRDSRAVDGLWFRLRRMADVAPNLEELPTPMAAILKSTLLAEQLTKGGLVFITGGPGCGKTTTASAIVVSRLLQYGGVAYTVEDPPEMPLNGRHGRGYCTQTWVAGDDSADWAESMRGVLRSQPVGTNLMLYVGEVRDAETGRAMLRAASNGFLVVSTGFGNDIVSGIDAFFQLCGREYATSVASVLRVVLYQKIIDGKFNAQMLVSENAASPVAAIIRNGQIAQLQNEVNYQKNRQISGEAFFQLPKAKAA